MTPPVNEPRYAPVAARDVLAPRPEAGRRRQDEAAARSDLGLERLVLRRIDHVEPAGEDSHGAARERGLVIGGIEAAGEARDDDQVGITQPVGDLPRDRVAGSRTVSRPDDCDRRLVELPDIAPGVEHRRRMIEAGEQRRVAGLDCEPGLRADHPRGVEFTLRCLAGAHEQALAPAVAHQFRQRLKCGLGPAEVADQAPKDNRPDVLRPDQAQAREPLPVTERSRGQRRRARSECHRHLTCRPGVRGAPARHRPSPARPDRARLSAAPPPSSAVRCSGGA